MTEFEQKIAGALKKAIEDTAKDGLEETIKYMRKDGDTEEEIEAYRKNPAVCSTILNELAVNAVCSDIEEKLLSMEEYAWLGSSLGVGSDNVCINKDGENYCDYDYPYVNDLDYLDLTIEFEGKDAGKCVGCFDIQVKFHPTEDCTDFIKYRFLDDKVVNADDRANIPWKILK